MQSTMRSGSHSATATAWGSAAEMTVEQLLYLIEIKQN